jgi:hypothetical protein
LTATNVPRARVFFLTPNRARAAAFRREVVARPKVTALAMTHASIFASSLTAQSSRAASP